MSHIPIRENVNPCKEEEKTLRSSSNLTSPCVCTPPVNDNATIIVMMPYHELKTPYWPNSLVDIMRVNMGVVIIDIPFCKNEHIKNHKEALTCIGNDLYFPNILLVLIALPLHEYTYLFFISFH